MFQSRLGPADLSASRLREEDYDREAGRIQGGRPHRKERRRRRQNHGSLATGVHRVSKENDKVT
jgi:hypothetical protein